MMPATPSATSNLITKSLSELTHRFFYVLLDTKGQLLEYNAAFRDLWPAGKTFSAFPFLLQLSSLPAWEDTVKALATVAYNHPQPVELWHLTGEGRSVCVQWEWVQLAGDSEMEFRWAGYGMLVEEEQAFFKEMIRTVPAMLWSDDAGQVPLFVNKAWTDFTGWKLTDLIEQGWEKLVHPEDLSSVEMLYRDCIANRLPIRIEYRFLYRQDRFRWVLEQAVPQYDAAGLFIGYAGSIADIHENKLQLEKLNYQAIILNNVTDIVVTADLQSNVTSWNMRAEEFYGHTQQEATGKLITDLVQIEYLNISRKEVHDIVERAGNWKGEVAHTDSQGNRRYLLNRLTYIINENYERIGYLAIGTDITERKIAEQKLIESEFFFRNLIRHSIDAIFLTDKEGVILYGSPSVTEILGYEADELRGHSFFDYMETDVYDDALSAFSHNYAGAAENEQLVIRVRKKSGEYIWCLVRGHRLSDNSLNADMALYIFDYTSRKKAEVALQESEQRFKNMTRELTLGVVSQDHRSRLIFCNNTALELLGVTRAQLAGEAPHDPQWNIIAENGRNLRARHFPVVQAIVTKRPVKDMVIGVFNPSRGERTWLLVNAEPVFDEEGKLMHVISSYTDITVRKKLELRLIEQEIQKQKHITRATIDGQERERRELGVLLHDNFGQRLTSLKLYLDILGDTSSGSSREMVALAQDNVQSLIDEMRALSHALTPSTLGDLGLLESLEDLFERVMSKHGFSIRFSHDDFQSDHLPDSHQLMIFRIVEEQMNNIIHHAGARLVHINLGANALHALLEITDDGKGFDRDDINHGKGFQTIQNRVQLVNGEVEIYSLPGQGCSLKAIFPLAS